MEAGRTNLFAFSAHNKEEREERGRWLLLSVVLNIEHYAMALNSSGHSPLG